MQLYPSDIRTREVLSWRGVHLIHFRFSACSQKLRIFLNLKQIEWESHHLNLARQQNYEDWFLGINPRGLVPVLVHNGDVHIESNDIIQYLEAQFPERPLIPAAQRAEITAGLKEEDDLHLDIRAITMGFLSPKALVTKNDERLRNYEQNDGTLQGESDPHKAVELKFWQDFAANGVTEMQALEAARRFHTVYQRFDAALSGQAHLAGEDLTLLDIAWYIYTFRLKAAGYPFEQLHPRVDEWYARLARKPEFAREVAQPFAMNAAVKVLRGVQTMKQTRLVDIMRRGNLMTGATDAI